MQFGFVPGRGTTDAIFIVRQVQEKTLRKNKKLFLGFVDLEKAFDRVPREVVKWALRKERVPEALISAVMATYKGAKTAVKVGCGMSEDFEVKVGVHQGSVLSPLLFIIVMQAVSREDAQGLPWELLYADDLVVMAHTEEELKHRLLTWKKCLENKGLKVNMEKTKVMCSERNRGEVKHDCEFPCGVCGRNVGNNSVRCTSCGKWVHYRCSKVKGRLTVIASRNYICAKCKGKESLGEGFETGRNLLVNDGQELESVLEFCY